MSTLNAYRDGATSPCFVPVPFEGNATFDNLGAFGVSASLIAAIPQAARGDVTGWGIPFTVRTPIILADKPVRIEFAPFQARQLVFLHTSDMRPDPYNDQGFIMASRGHGQLGELAATYVVSYSDGTQERIAIRRRHHLGTFQRNWGENCFEAVAIHKPMSLRASHEQTVGFWGVSQTRVDPRDSSAFVSWLYAWENPHPDLSISSVSFEPVSGVLVISALTAGDVSSQPLRWRNRRKLIFTLPEGMTFDPTLDADGQLSQIQIDMGQVISAQPRLMYPLEQWEHSDNNQLPTRSERQVIVEYACHPDARFHLPGGKTVPVAEVEAGQVGTFLEPVAPQSQRVTLRVVVQGSTQPVPVKLHVHGQAGEYLAPVDRHRIPNPAWFEDYSVDFYHQALHACTYIAGETTLDLPLGKVYIEVSKGFEIRPQRLIFDVTPTTTEIVIELEKALHWREKGWVTADTHVHFLSPISALLEGSAEGVNVVNLLASQWGELMTNVGDFDGHTTWGSSESGGDGEYLVRVGTENRQHVLGHISLLGYGGRIIAPMTTGGPDESAMGDPIESLLTEWARQCKHQGGLVVLPHFPNPRAEHAATIVSGNVDALEMTSWGDLYRGIDPYSVSDWYRYLNCGYMVAACGGTDKMSSDTAVGTVRTYARIDPGTIFNYQSWMQAIRRAETFVTYGPLLDFMVNGRPMGSRIPVPRGGGTFDVTWQVASVTIPLTRVELVINGEIRESVSVTLGEASGHWSIPLERSSWLALLVRGKYSHQTEIIAAHSSPVLVKMEGSPLLAAADAVTILEQIEGALAYLDTVGTRAEDLIYKRMRLELISAHRSLHNRMHELGYLHPHSPATDHPSHHIPPSR